MSPGASDTVYFAAFLGVEVVNNPKPDDADLQKQAWKDKALRDLMAIGKTVQVLLLWNTAFPDQKLEIFEKGQSSWASRDSDHSDPGWIA